MTGLGVVASGALIALSTFLAWVTIGGDYPGVGGVGLSTSGWNWFWHGAMGMVGKTKITFFSTGDGMIFFSGFWSLLFGVLLLLLGILIVSRRKLGSGLSVVCGLLGLGVAAVNIVMIFTKLEPEVGAGVRTSFSYTIGPGIGLYLFAGFALLAIILGIVSFRYME